MDKYVVTIYNPRSEWTYTFGPFNENELDEFDKKVWENDSYDYDSIVVNVINDPSLFGSGDEIG